MSNLKLPLQITSALVLLLVVMSAYPGLIGSTVFSFFGIFTLLPALGGWILFIGFMALRDVLQRGLW